jgi:hypothetical protein
MQLKKAITLACVFLFGVGAGSILVYSLMSGREADTIAVSTEEARDNTKTLNTVHKPLQGQKRVQDGRQHGLATRDNSGPLSKVEKRGGGTKSKDMAPTREDDSVIKVLEGLFGDEFRKAFKKEAGFEPKVEEMKRGIKRLAERLEEHIRYMGLKSGFLENRRRKLGQLEVGKVVLQVTAGHEGGNPCTVRMDGHTSSFVKEFSLKPIPEEELSKPSSAIAHVSGGFVPEGCAFLISKINLRVYANSSKSSAGFSSLHIHGSGPAGFYRGGVCAPFEAIWTGSMTIKPGEEECLQLGAEYFVGAHAVFEGQVIPIENVPDSEHGLWKLLGPLLPLSSPARVVLQVRAGPSKSGKISMSGKNKSLGAVFWDTEIDVSRPLDLGEGSSAYCTPRFIEGGKKFMVTKISYRGFLGTTEGESHSGEIEIVCMGEIVNLKDKNGYFSGTWSGSREISGTSSTDFVQVKVSGPGSCEAIFEGEIKEGK